MIETSKENTENMNTTDIIISITKYVVSLLLLYIIIEKIRKVKQKQKLNKFLMMFFIRNPLFLIDITDIIYY